MAACVAMIAPANAVELDFSYNTAGDPYVMYGFAKVEDYDVAIRLTDPALVGVKVVGFYVEASSEGTSGYSGWLSKELKLDKKVNKPDIVSKPGTVGEDGFLRITFDEPYTITSEGVYVGYSMSVNKLLDEFDAYPIALVEGVNDNGFFLHTSRSRMKWSNYSSRIGGVSTMVVVLDGDFKDNAAGVALAETLYAPVGKASSIEATLTNHGAKPVSSVSYSYKAGDVSGSGEVTLPTPVKAFFGATGEVSLPIDALPEMGTCDFSLTIDKVNGEENTDITATAVSQIEVIPFVPVNRPLVEEYTGMWCGYCPIGYIALETLRKDYGGYFVAAAYHNDDEIATLSDNEYPSYISGFPASYVNRGMNEVYPGDLTAEWPKLRKSVPLADIDVSVAWEDADKTKLSATSTFRFIKDMNGADYKVGYILVADGLTNPDWKQSNYLTGDYSLEGEYADLFINGSSYVYDLVYNDVVLSADGIFGVEGSVPADIKADTPYTHTFVFDTNSVVNIDGAAVIQDSAKLRVIAFLYDSYSDEVLNSNSSDYASGDPFSGLENVGVGNAEVTSTEFYDLRGSRIFKPASGLYLKSEKMSDGTRRVSKVVVR